MIHILLLEKEPDIPVSITTLSTSLETQTQVLRQMLEKQDAVIGQLLHSSKFLAAKDR